MGMQRIITRPMLDGVPLSTLEPAVGGTGQDTAPEVLVAIGAVAASNIGQALGPVGLDSSGKISPEFVGGVSGVNIDGTLTVVTSSVTNYTITNYDSFTTYNITPVFGAVSITDNIITYTAPAAVGIDGFTINGKTFNINVVEPLPVTPVILTPSNGSVVSYKALTINASDFAMQIGTDNHIATDWLVATDPDFNNIVNSSINDSVNLTSWSIVLPNTGVTYYFKVRYMGGSTGYSNYSDVAAITITNVIISSNEIAKVNAWSPESGEWFGQSVSITSDGSRIAVGAPRSDSLEYIDSDSGAVYIFTKTGSVLSFEAKLTASDKVAGAQFGHSLAISSDGSRIVIGAYSDNNNPYDGSGAAYIFSRSDVTWSQEARLVANDFMDYDAFGISVSISADATRVAVGAYLADPDSRSDAGAAYIFSRSGVTWSQEAKLIASDYSQDGHFGNSVSINADATRVAVGSDYATIDSYSYVGKAYIFSRSGTTWIEEAKLIFDEEVYAASFGYSVAIDDTGNRVAIGAIQADGAISGICGAVYIFSRSGVTWTQEAKLSTATAITYDVFGYSISINSDASKIVVAAPGVMITIGDYQGAAFVFTRSGTVWTEEYMLSASDKAENNQFGSSVAISSDGNTIVSGSINAEALGMTDVGAAYIFAL